MTTTNKYIIVDNIFPILFTEATSHNEFKRLNITSAGFFTIDSFGLISIFGNSASLNINSKKEDLSCISLMLKGVVCQKDI